MKILKQFVTVLAVAGTTITIASNAVVSAKAEEWNNYSIHQSCTFDVDVVGDNGGFIHKGCYTNFEDAKNAMIALGDDAVVRTEASLSPTKIIAMVNGVVISNPYRSGNSLSYYYMNADFSGSNTYSQQYMQSQYHSTDWYSNGNGAVAITMNGFEGYIPLKDCDLVPVKYFTNHLPIILGGNNSEDPKYTIYPEMNKYVVTTDASGNKEMKFYSYWGWSNSASNPSQTYATPNRTGTTLPAADWMVSGTTYYSYNGYDFYTDQALTKLAGTYYNYYQFLPLRTKSNLSANDLQTYLLSSGRASVSVMNNNAQAFIDGQNTYGVNALLVYAMALHESAFGTSNLAVTRANLFGWNAVDSNPNLASSYASIASAVAQQMGTNINGYMDIDDGRHFGMAIGNKGNGMNVCYASDAYWGISIASYAYQIDKAAGFKDLNSITLGVVDSSSNVYFTKTSSTNTKWYDLKNPGGTKYGNYIARAYLVPILSEENGKYKTSTSDILTNGALTRAANSNGKSYDFNTNVAWINTEWVTVLNNGTPTSTVEVPDEPVDDNTTPDTTPDVTPVDDETDDVSDTTITDQENASYDLLRSVNNVSYDETSHVVTLDGMAFFSGAYAPEEGITDEIILVNSDTGEKTVIPATNTTYERRMTAVYEGYIGVGYEANIDLDDIAPGNYYLQIHVINGTHDETKSLYSNTLSQSYVTRDEYGYDTKFFTSSINGYRLEISCEKQELHIDGINQPSTMVPYFSEGTVTYENGHLTLTDGYSFFRNSSMALGDNPQMTFYLQDENGTVTSYTATVKESKYNFAQILSSNFDLSYASYDVDMDLTELEAGTYRMYLELETDTYHDLFEIYTIRSVDTTWNDDSHVVSLQSTDVRQRFILTIE